MTDLTESFNKIREKQNEAFLNKILPRNRKEGKIILTKYDLKFSILDIINFDEDFNVNREKIKNLFNERAKFLKLISEYL